MIAKLSTPAALRILNLVGFIMATLLPCFGQNSPKFEGTSIPVPPAQTQPWTAPQTKLPAVVVSAMMELFNDGMADPRGCEYREIEVITGAWSSDGGGLKTHGWVMPAQGNQTFAVCWNGLVYPVISEGAPADLHKDMEQLSEMDRSQIDAAHAQNETREKERKESLERSGQKYQHVEWPTRWNQNAIPERLSAATDYMQPVKAALLLRLGETDLAEKVWFQWDNAPSASESQDPYLSLASSWVFTLFDRAVSAHMRGDDHLALASAQALVPIQQAVENQASKRPISGYQDGKPHLNFLTQLTDLIVDSQRRVDEPLRTPTLQRAEQPHGADRVAGLIQDLEFVSARQMGFPGGVNLMDDADVQALVQEGDGAVEPLLKCLVEDTRLTRSMQCGRPWFQQRDIIPVYQAAFVALSNILHTTDFGTNADDALTTVEGRADLADKIGAYWQRAKGKSPEEMAYYVLSDDHADPKQWLQAASTIVMPSNVTASPGRSLFGKGSFTSRPTKPGEIISMRGEPLRAWSNPSVSELLLKRMHDLSAPMNQLPDTNLQMKTQMALVLAKWDGKAHLDDLRSLSEIIKSRFTIPNQNIDSVVHGLLQVYQARLTAGDPQALSDYAAWLVSLPQDRLGFDTQTIFEIMWQHPTDPVIRETAEKLFASKDSPWVPLLNGHSGFTQFYFSSPLVGMAAFRTELLRGLTDKSIAGSATLDNNSYININLDGGGGLSGGSYFLDSSAPAAGTIVPVRTCDLYAFEISQLEGAPRFQLYWPVEKRDPAIPTCAQFLQRYGDLYQYQPNDSEEYDIFHKARIHFPKLDHPATQGDVDQNRAIFSLGGERRLWQMPAFPMKAYWTTLKDDREQGVQSNGKKVIVYNTEGKIFQAEEIDVNGQWQRFFGFVGLHHIAKVPAAEIEFTSYRRPLVPHFEGILSGPPTAVPSGAMFPAFSSIKVGDPMPITFKVRNINGADQKLPAVLTPPTTDGKTFPTGLTVVLLHTNTLLQAETLFRSAVDSIKWESVPLKSQTASAAMPVPSPILGPEEEYTVSNLNLRDLFDLSRVGTYRLYVTTDPKETPSQLSESLIFTEKAEN
jgi:hypothetical protein